MRKKSRRASVGSDRATGHARSRQEGRVVDPRGHTRGARGGDRDLRGSRVGRGMLCGTCAFGMAAPGAFGASARVSTRQSCATSIPMIGRRGRGATVWRAAATRGDDALTGRDRESRDIPRWDSARRAGARGNGSTPGATGTSVAERVSAASETRRAEAPKISEEIVVEAPSAIPPARDPTEALTVEEPQDEEPSRPPIPPRANGRRLFMATLASAVVAETAGQVVERTMISESARLRLEQKRRVIRGSIRSSGLEFEDRPRGGDAIGKEVKRASAIAALAALGAVGSRVITKPSEAPSTRLTRRDGRGSIGRGDVPHRDVRFDSVDEDDEDEDAARTSASTSESSIPGARDFRFPGPLEGWTSEDFAKRRQDGDLHHVLLEGSSSRTGSTCSTRTTGPPSSSRVSSSSSSRVCSSS